MRLTTPSVLALFLSWSTVGDAGDADPDETVATDDAPVAQGITVGVSAANLAPLGGIVGYRLRATQHFQLGVDLMGGLRRRSYIAGYEAKGGGELGGLVVMQGTMLRQGPLALDLRGALGARHVSSTDVDVAHARGTSVVAELGVVGYVAAAEWLTLRVGWSSPFALAVQPGVDLETTGFVVLGGGAFAVTEGFALTVDGHVGGLFGFDGDGAKATAGAQLGLRWTIGAGVVDWRNY